MAMTAAELQRYLDPKRIGGAPILVKLGVLLVVLMIIVGLSFYFDWQDQLDRIQSETNKEEGLRKTFLEKKREAVNLPAYQKQLEDIEKQFGALLKQLPGRSEMDALLTDINQAGLGRGLQFDLFRPAPQERMADFYAELPINIKITGNYHDMGAFASDVAQLPRIVTLNDVGIANDKGTLTLEAIAKTFRYLDDEEVAKQRAIQKAAKDKGKGQKK